LISQAGDKSKCIIKSKSQQNQNQKNQSLEFTVFSFQCTYSILFVFFEAGFVNSSIFGKNSIFYEKVTDNVGWSIASGGVLEFVYFLIIPVYCIMVVTESYLFIIHICHFSNPE
jgi:hypothetical protein